MEPRRGLGSTALLATLALIVLFGTALILNLIYIDAEIMEALLDASKAILEHGDTSTLVAYTALAKTTFITIIAGSSAAVYAALKSVSVFAYIGYRRFFRLRGVNDEEYEEMVAGLYSRLGIAAIIAGISLLLTASLVLSDYVLALSAGIQYSPEYVKTLIDTGIVAGITLVALGMVAKAKST